MKRNLMIIALTFFSVAAWSQENRFTLSGGYAFANIEAVDTDATGFRINGLYELNPLGGKVAHGFSIGYIGTSADFAGVAGQSNEYKINSWPVYYAPKLMFGDGSVQGFIKGALGMQFSGLTRTGTLGEFNDKDFGFYGGAGAGIMKTFNEKMFVNLEYEWAYLSNSFYKDGFMNSIMLGIGFKF
ncbi:MAG: outer membrane beta-barrel protein [Bacteroidota bacterium]